MPIAILIGNARAALTVLTVGSATMRVADLRDVAGMNWRTGRPKDKAALYAIEATIEEQRKKRKKRPGTLGG